MKYSLVATKNTKKIPSVLREKSKRVEKITPEILDLVKQMKKIMKENAGIGISAVQVGVPIQMIIIKDCDTDYVFINPRIKRFSRNEAIYNEGCLSFPGYFADISRPESVVVSAKDLEWKDIEIKAEGIISRCLQHEIDHLDGIVFVDHVES